VTDEHHPSEDEQLDEVPLKTPFSFKLMIVLTVAYLGWRLVEGIVKLIEWIRG